MTDDKYVATFVRDHVDAMARVHWNHCKMPRKDNGKGWTTPTVRTTVFICLWLWENHYLYACEVKMKGRELRADILVPELYGAQVIEVTDSEGPESIARKAKKYDELGVSMLAVPANFKLALSLIRKANGI